MTADGQIPPELPTQFPSQPQLTQVAPPSSGQAGVAVLLGETLAARVEFVSLAAMMVTGILAWGVGVYSLGYDYDEVRYVHSVWLTAPGTSALPRFPRLSPAILRATFPNLLDLSE